MTKQSNHDALTLEQIEDDDWGDPPADATRLIQTAHKLRRKAVATLSPEDLRLLIGQEIGVEVLVPRALAILAQGPLVEGDFYPGDLLAAVLGLPTGYRHSHPDQAATLGKIAGAVQNPGPDLKPKIDSFGTTGP